MVALLWETALLLLGAYFLGAFFGCMIRRLLFSGGAEVETAPALAPAGAAAAGVAVAGVAAGSASRFEQALSGERMTASGSEAPATALAGRDAELVEPKIETISAQLSEHEPTEPPPAEAASDAPEPRREPFATVASQVGPGATAASLLGTAAFARSSPEGDNDLRDIRGIDDAMARSLRGLGVTRWEDIAAWSAADVAGIEAELGLGSRIQREAWIEQASILAAGGSTAFAAKRTLGVAETAAAPLAETWAERPPADEPAAQPIEPEAAPEPSPVAEDDDRAAIAAAAAAAAAVAATAAATGTGEPADHVSEDAEVAELEETRLEMIEPRAPIEEGPFDAPPPAAEPIDPAPPSDPSDLPRAAGTDGAAVTSAWTEDAEQPPANGEIDAPDEERWTWDASDVSAGQVVPATGAAEVPERMEPVPAEDDELLTTPIVAAGSAAIAGAGALLATTQADAAEDGGPLKPIATEPVSGLRSVRSEALVGDKAMPHGADDLKRIRGLGVREETRLRSLGVTTYAQIAKWSADDVTSVDRELGLGGRIARENWIEQAQVLEGGMETEFARRRDRGEADVITPVATVPAYIPPVAETEPVAPLANENVGAEASGEPDLGPEPTLPTSLEPDTPVTEGPSIADRITTIAPFSEPDASDANAGDDSDDRAEIELEPAPVLEPEPEPESYVPSVDPNAGEDDGFATVEISPPAASGASAVAPGAALRSVRSAALGGEATAGADDLKRIRGIGVLIEKRLNAMGVTSYDQIANWRETDIQRVNAELAFQNRIEREKWIEQARILVSGGQTEFSRRMDRGEV